MRENDIHPLYVIGNLADLMNLLQNKNDYNFSLIFMQISDRKRLRF